MKNRLFRNGIIVMTIIAVVGLGSYAFAYRGSGGNTGKGGQGSEWNNRGHAGYGCPAWNDLTEAETEKLKKAREKFRNDTDDLRQEIYAKKMELRSELAQKDTDAKKAVSLQKELSKLEGQFDEKRLAHQLALKEINPKLGRNYGGRGPMKGYSQRGGGNCWR